MATMVVAPINSRFGARTERCFKRPSGIFRPIPAVETGLIKPGYLVESDRLGSEIDIARLSFEFCPISERHESGLRGEALLAIAARFRAVGSLGLGKIILDRQAQRTQVIPIGLRSLGAIVLLTSTIVVAHRVRTIPGFEFLKGEWRLDFYPITSCFTHRCRLVLSAPLRRVA